MRLCYGMLVDPLMILQQTLMAICSLLVDIAVLTLAIVTLHASASGHSVLLHIYFFFPFELSVRPC